MSVDQLQAALASVDWQANIAISLADNESMERLDKACTRIATWSRQFELVDKGNPALSFIRGLQVCSQHIVACTCLGLYRAAASSIRGTVENGLYYSYFRAHTVELATLVRESSFYLSRGELIDYHKTHTPEFKDLQNKLGLIGRLDEWYKRISSVVHGQIPGEWVEHVSLGEIEPQAKTLQIVVKEFEEGEKILHDFFLITVGRQNWDAFSAKAKKSLISGLSAEVKTALRIDRA